MSTTARPAGLEMVGQRPQRRRLGRPVGEQQQRVEGEERQPVPAVQVEVDEVGLDELEAGRRVRAGGDGPRPGTGEHRRIEIDAGDRPAGRGERDGQPAGADGQLEDRAADPGGQGEVQVEVAGILEQVDVVEPGERLAGRVDADAGSSRAAVVSARSGPADRPAS